MIKETFEFKSNSWHLKMIKFFWGYTKEDFQNMCPYFWLCVGTFIFSPIILIVQGLILLFGFIIKQIFDIAHQIEHNIERKQDEWIEKMKQELINNPDKRKWFASIDWKGKWGKVYDKIWYDYTLDDLRKEIEKERNEIYDRKSKENYNNVIKNREQINYLIEIFKPVIYFITWVFILSISFALAYCFMLLLSLIVNIEYNNWKEAIILAGKIILGIIGLIITTGTFILIIKKVEDIIGEHFTDKLISFFNFFSFILIPFKYIWKGLVWSYNGFVILFQILSSFKKDNCPAIVWKD